MSVWDLVKRKPPPIPADLAQTLESHGIATILKLIRDSYFDLVQMGLVTSDMDENEITEEWFLCLQDRWKQMTFALQPIHEKQDKTKKRGPRGKSPTVDCCFRSRWHKESYFGIECKLVEANDETLCNKYLENGVLRFVECRYSSKCSEGAMLGYVRQSQCQDVATRLQEKIDTLDTNSMFTQREEMLPLDTYYVSIHKRTGCLTPFTLHHLLLFFNVG